MRGLHRQTAMLVATASVCALAAIGCLSGDNSLPLTNGFDASLPDSGFTFGADGSVDGQVNPPLPDAGHDAGADAGFDAGHDAGTIDSGVDAGPAGKGGVGLAAGGTVSTSANYKLIGTVGQGPGSNASLSSPNYKLHGGVAGATQK